MLCVYVWIDPRMMLLPLILLGSVETRIERGVNGQDSWPESIEEDSKRRIPRDMLLPLALTLIIFNTHIGNCSSQNSTCLCHSDVSWWWRCCCWMWGGMKRKESSFMLLFEVSNGSDHSVLLLEATWTHSSSSSWKDDDDPHDLQNSSSSHRVTHTHIHPFHPKIQNTSSPLESCYTCFLLLSSFFSSSHHYGCQYYYYQ